MSVELWHVVVYVMIGLGVLVRVITHKDVPAPPADLVTFVSLFIIFLWPCVIFAYLLYRIERMLFP